MELDTDQAGNFRPEDQFEYLWTKTLANKDEV